MDMFAEITNAILLLRDEYLENEMPEGSTYWDINNGWCIDFAECVIDFLGGETDSLFVVGNDNFQTDEAIEKLWTYGAWDSELLIEHWQNVKPLNGLSWNELNDIVFGYHVWITDGKKHYDAECPEGVANFFELPIFKRCFTH